MNRLKKILSSKAGDSIVEIMVSVAVLLMISSFFIKSMSIATRVITKSDELKKRADNFCEEYYSGSIEQNSIGNGIKLKNSADNSEISIDTKLYKASDDNMSMYSFGIYEVSRE